MSKHAREEMAKDDLQEGDILNTLRGGWVEESKAAFEGNSWRYQIHTNQMVVVVAFREDAQGEATGVVVVTCWRK